MRTHLTPIVVAALFSIMMLMTAPLAQSADAFKLDVDRRGHYLMTYEALWFLDAKYQKWINDGHFQSDYGRMTSASRHMDNCRFNDNVDNINNFYRRIVKLKPEDFAKKEVAEDFGKILHMAQDFYSHSNWVELGRKESIDNVRDQYWKSLLRGFSTRSVPGIYVVDGAVHENWKFTHDKATNKVTAEVISGPFKGTKRPALVSGEVRYERGNCPEGAKLYHWGDWYNYKDGPGDLNKDHGGKPGYEEARKLALKQTINEWCRLLTLIYIEHGGLGTQKGSSAMSRLVSAWASGPNQNAGLSYCFVNRGQSGPTEEESDQLQQQREPPSSSLKALQEQMNKRPQRAPAPEGPPPAGPPAIELPPPPGPDPIAPPDPLLELPPPPGIFEPGDPTEGLPPIEVDPPPEAPAAPKEPGPGPGTTLGQ